MLSLHKIRCGSAVSSNVKLRLTFLLLHSPVIIFAQDRLHSAIKEQALIALVCTIFAQDRLHSAIKEQALIALVCTIFVPLYAITTVANGWLMPLRAVPEHLTRNCNCIQ